MLQRELVVPVEDICLVPHARPERLLLPPALAVPIHIEVRPDVPEVDWVDCHGGQDGVTTLQVGSGNHASEEPGAVPLPVPLRRIEIRGINYRSVAYKDKTIVAYVKPSNVLRNERVSDLAPSL